jgi:PAS domain S-box-containing protein
LEARVLARTRELALSHESVQHSEARLAGIVGSAMDAILSVDDGQKIVLFNASAEKVFGCTAAAAMGQSLDRFIPQCLREQHQRHVEDFGGKEVSSRSMHSLEELCGLRANGGEFPIEASISKIEVAGQRLFTVILRDISERKQTAAALVSSELSYRRLFEAAEDGILILDFATGQIQDVNPYLCRLPGFFHEEMVGKTVGELSPFKDVLSNQVMLERLQQEGYVRYDNLPLETQDGHPMAVEFVCNVYPVGLHKVIQCNIRGITQRRHAEMALLRLAAIVEYSDDATIGKDLNSIISSWNKGAEKIFGHAAAEMTGTGIPGIVVQAHGGAGLGRSGSPRHPAKPKGHAGMNAGIPKTLAGCVQGRNFCGN